ncbi:MAG TPA: hypothetical protein VFW02_03705 [Candidatus Limnocylindrales bacterium]|nr:hypothetical protein [Candidatus Limnocylindrales bacterium]
MTRRALAGALARVVATVTWLTVAVPALAASPGPTTGPGGDPRSSGQGPGLVGDPVLAVLVVVAIGIAAVALTFVYVRLTDRHGA